MELSEDEIDLEIKKENLEKIKIQNAILKKEYAKVDELEKVYSFLIVAFKNRLQNLPRQVSGRVFGLSSTKEIERVLEAEVNACLSELSKNDKQSR